MKRLKIAYQHTLSPNGGFGVLGKGIFEGLKKNPNFEVVYFNGEYLSEAVPDVIFTYGMPELWEVVKELRRFYDKRIRAVHYFVWESSELPVEFVRSYRRWTRLLTATKYTALNAAKKGLKAKVWHHAVDDRFVYSPRPDDGVFTFLHHNAYEFRKGWEQVLQAFVEEFKPSEPVQLILKARERKQSVWMLPKPPVCSYETNQWRRKHPREFLKTLKLDFPNVKEVIGHITDSEMTELNRTADCFIFPAKGEGWGLPPFEAMAQGIVPIIPNKGCFTEWFTPEGMVEVRTNGYINTAPRYPGYMFSISLKSLRRKMRWAYEHQSKLETMGKRGSEIVREKYNWTVVINELYELLK
jgi:glycosyltransferase involved in cell wall biosynthesis